MNARAEPHAFASAIPPGGIAPFRVVSLFSGCGGMDLGFRGGFEVLGRAYAPNPFQVVWANDLNEAACRTYRKNLGGEILAGDIWTHIDRLPATADVVIGGFPCQDISVNGKGRGVQGARSGLYRAMVETVRRVKPRAFVAENVKGLLMKHNRASLDIVLHDFRDLGYDVGYQLYQCADYGVPQSRERVFIVGTLPGQAPYQPPPPVLAAEDWVLARDALHDLINHPSDAAFSHIWSQAKKSPDQGSRRLRADRTGYTIRAECHGNIQFHYALDRRISMREAARLQSFPDSFLFDARLRETERQIGNAVPPVMAWHIARQVAQIL
jgi:DNA-methyltransferase (dcm)